ncbi:MAG: SLC13 family permease [Candidatus Bathyarchaeia archaeon]
MEIGDLIKVVTAIIFSILLIWVGLISGIQGRILILVFWALVLWSLYPERHLESSIIVIALLSLFQASLNIEDFIRSLFETYGGSGLWIIVSGFVLAKGMENSGLAKRISLHIVSLFGGRPRLIILSVALSNLAIAPLSPSTTAKAFLLLPVFVGLVESFEVEKGSSNYGAAVMLMAMAANNICSTAFLTATVPNPISAQYLEQTTGISLGWSRWFIMAFPLSIVLLFVAWLLCILIHPPEVEASSDARIRIERLKESLGEIELGELIMAIIFTLSLLLWITDGLHPYNAGIISLILSLTLFIPRMGILSFEGVKGSVPLGSITLFAASMFMAKAVGKYDALYPVARGVFHVFNLSNFGVTLFIVLITTVSMLLHIIFTSTTVYATVMVPLVISLSNLQEVPPISAALPIAFIAPIAVILPVNTIPNIVFYSSGYFNQRQIIFYGITLSILSSIIVLAFGVPYWRFIGLL